MSGQTLYLERPSFWTEDRDPECWYRGLKALAGLEQAEGAIRGTPRTIWERCLKQVFSRRSIHGFFGLAPDREEMYLLGAGLLKYNPAKTGWELTDIARPLAVGEWEDREALTRLASVLLQISPWLRLLAIRLLREDWALQGWRGLRDGTGKLKAGSTLILHRFPEEPEWFLGIEKTCAGQWSTDERLIGTVRLHPEVLTRDSRRDDFSWAPFKAPLYLFDYLGWLVEDGRLRIPHPVMVSTGLEIAPSEAVSASAVLKDLTEQEADLRKFVPVEGTLWKLHQRLHPKQELVPEAFAAWMDALMTSAIGKGAIEILAAEPGQARHGRGLFGDRQRKLAKWVVHDDFDQCVAEVESGITTDESENNASLAMNERGPAL